MVGALGAQPVRERERLLEPTQVDRAEGGHLVDDHLRLGLGDGPGDRLGVEAVGGHRGRAELAEEVELALAFGSSP